MTTIGQLVSVHRDEVRSHCIDLLGKAGQAEDDVRGWLDDALDDLAIAFADGGMHAFSLDFGHTLTAASRGRARMRQGRPLAAVVRDFAVVCDAICVVAAHHGDVMEPSEFRTLNGWVDGGITAGVEEYASAASLERTAMTASELAAIMVEIGNATAVMRDLFDVMREANAPLSGPAASVLGRSLARVETLVTTSLAMLIVRNRGPLAS